MFRLLIITRKCDALLNTKNALICTVQLIKFIPYICSVVNCVTFGSVQPFKLCIEFFVMCANKSWNKNNNKKRLFFNLKPAVLVKTCDAVSFIQHKLGCQNDF